MSSGVRGFPSWPGASAPIRGLIHWCETTDSSLTIFPCNARRVHTLGSSAFRLSTRSGVNVTRGLVLLSGIGTQALPSWDSKTRWNDLLGGLAVGRSKQTRELTSSIVPRGTPVHRLVELGFPPTSFDLVGCSSGCSLPGPAELCAVNPDTVQYHGQPPRQCDNSSFHPAPSGNLHRPGLESGPFC